MRKVPFKGSPKYYLGNTSTCDLLPSAGCPLKSLFALNPTWRFMGSYTRGYMSHKMPTHATTCRHAQTRNVPTQAAIPKGRKMCMATYAQTRKKCARAISGERKESSEREREGVQKHDDMPELEMCQHACRHATSPYFSPCHRSQRHKHLQQWAHFDRIVLSLQPTY